MYDENLKRGPFGKIIGFFKAGLQCWVKSCIFKKRHLLLLTQTSTPHLNLHHFTCVTSSAWKFLLTSSHANSLPCLSKIGLYAMLADGAS